MFRTYKFIWACAVCQSARPPALSGSDRLSCYGVRDGSRMNARAAGVAGPGARGAARPARAPTARPGRTRPGMRVAVSAVACGEWGVERVRSGQAHERPRPPAAPASGFQSRNQSRLTPTVSCSCRLGHRFCGYPKARFGVVRWWKVAHKVVTHQGIQVSERCIWQWHHAPSVELQVA